MEKTLLTPKQEQLLGLASQEKIITSQFFLTGGTALAKFYFQHRFSEDLDFFSETEYDSKQILSWAAKTAKKLSAKLEQQTLTGQEIYYFHFKDNTFVKIDFSYFPFPHLGKFVYFNKLRVSSIEDIAVNKAQAIITRKRARDYLDLYLCMEKLGWYVDDLLKNYQLKYGVHISNQQLATSFINVVDASDLPKFLGEIDWEQVTKFYLMLAEQLKSTVLKD